MLTGRVKNIAITIMIIIKLKESRRSLGSGNADKNGTEACKRMSKQRKKILDLVKSGRLGHPTAAEVYDEVRKSMPNISLGTVYRNLNMLADDGDISRVDLGDGCVSRFDCETSEHSHFVCRCCGGIYDAPIGSIEREKLLSAFGEGFEADWANIAFTGYCPKCVEKMELENKEK